MSDLRERCLRNGDMCKMEDPPALGYAETFYKAAAELDRLTAALAKAEKELELWRNCSDPA